MRVRLLSTDFDGTMVGFGEDGVCTRDLGLAIQRHGERGGLWAVNTGRSLEHALEGLRNFSGPREPDFLLTNEREVYRRGRSGQWEDYGDWNERCRQMHEELYEVAGDVFREVKEFFSGWAGMRVVCEDGGRLSGLVAVSDEEMDAAVVELRRIAGRCQLVSFQRNAIYLRFCHAAFDKGSALGELCRLEGLSAEEVFAAGDHYNDLPMLDSRRAVYLACPANAVAEVRWAVMEQGGFVACRKFGDGLADGINFFCNERVVV